MSEFAQAVAKVLAREGGFVDHAADPGGETNFGISTRFLRGLGDMRSVKTLTRDDAIALYRAHFWDALALSEIASQEIADKVMDIAVNMGLRRAAFVVQRALRALHAKVAEDGVFGPVTREKINWCAPEPLLVALRCEAAAHYRSIGGVFLQSWLKRAYDEPY